MGILLDGIAFLFGAAKESKERAAAISELKRGKTPEQKRAIDFFLDDGGCFKSKGSSLTMNEYQKMVAAKYNQLNLRARAIEKIGFDESQIQEIDPILLTAFHFDDDSLVKVQGNEAVSDKFSTTWIFFSDLQMFTYQYIFELTSDNTWEYTHDFFYKDIVDFRTSRRVREKIDPVAGCGCFNKDKDGYVKNNFVDYDLDVSVPGLTYNISARYTDAIENSIHAARAMLREKKASS